jgi:hypothetical protein
LRFNADNAQASNGDPPFDSARWRPYIAPSLQEQSLPRNTPLLTPTTDEAKFPVRFFGGGRGTAVFSGAQSIFEN